MDRTSPFIAVDQTSPFIAVDRTNRSFRRSSPSIVRRNAGAILSDETERQKEQQKATSDKNEQASASEMMTYLDHKIHR
jgi:hypothetical protein